MGIKELFNLLPPRLFYTEQISEVETLPIPSEARLLWRGRQLSDLAIKTGDTVKTGQNLARYGKGLFVSTVTGRVDDISLFLGPDNDQYAVVTIAVRPNDIPDPSLKPLEDFSKMTPLELRTAITRAGFETFSAVTDDLSMWPSIKGLIITAFDRDLSSISNQQSFRDNAEVMEDAIGLVHRATEASQCCLVLPDFFSDTMAGHPITGADIVAIPPIYPDGLPEILARRIGKGVLMKRTPVGLVGDTLVISVEDAVGMLTALSDGRPMLDKTVTFSSGRRENLRNFKARIGTPVSHIMAQAGVNLEAGGKIILDGIFRGYTSYSDRQPVTRTTESIHIQEPSEIFSFQNTQCINCGKCNDICPVNLEANLLGRCSEYGLFEKCMALGAENCVACGLCAYVCPAHRPLVQLISHAKYVIETEHLVEPVEKETLPLEQPFHPLPMIRLIEPEPEEKEVSKQ